jgi:DNA-binding NtrC family response regulator
MATLRKILVVDDDWSTRTLVVRALEDDFAVETAADAEAALALAGDGQFAAVLADHHLPGESGRWLLAELARRCPATRRLLFSSDHGGANEANAEAPVEAFFPKPLPLQRVRETLDRLLAAGATSGG